jgi:hypothetical protein
MRFDIDKQAIAVLPFCLFQKKQKGKEANLLSIKIRLQQFSQQLVLMHL